MGHPVGKATRIVVAVLLVLVAAVVAGVMAFGPRYNIYLFPPSPSQYAADALDYMDFGIHASSDDWNRAKAEALQKAQSIGSYEEAHAILDEAIKVAGGKHSSVESASTTKQAADSDSPATTFALDDAGILHFAIPATPMGTPSSYYASPVAFMQQNSSAIKAAIVDLRGNTGGDMGPMIAALSPLFEDGTLLEFRMPAWGYTAPVTLDNGKVEGGGSTIQVSPFKLGNIPIAVLQDERTASSGEATLLAFRGLEQARTFGMPSAGYCSSNTVRTLYDGATMLLTIGTDVARTGEEFCEDPIAPDVQTSAALEDARAWLLGITD